MWDIECWGQQLVILKGWLELKRQLGQVILREKMRVHHSE
jgi:hypothetical protein